jgi:hypothetical protein
MKAYRTSDYRRGLFHDLLRPFDTQPKQSSIPDLRRVAKIIRQLAEERIEASAELVDRLAMPLKLKEEWAGVKLKFCVSVRSQHEIIEERRIEKPRIRLSGLHAIAGLQPGLKFLHIP